MALSSPEAGFSQVKQNLSLESLANFTDDGRPRPSVAEGWTVSDDRRTVTLSLRPNVQFQDGTLVTANDVVGILKGALPRSMGPAFADIKEISVKSDREVTVRFERPSGFRLEILETQVQKPGRPTVGTGPYSPVPGNDNELQANRNYYLGNPIIDRITIQSYPSFRSAWAEMLRNQTDVLYEVGVDALDSLQNAPNVAHVFTYPRRYQYLILLNTATPALQSSELRRALNLAIDRDALVADALNGHGKASIGPVTDAHWAVAGHEIPTLQFDAARAAAIIAAQKQPVRFTCLVIPDYERLALVAKRQLQAVGVDMTLEEIRTDQLSDRLAKHDFEAFLADAISGPTMYRLYRFWHSGETLNPGGIGSPDLDAALDAIRHSASDEEYRAGVVRFQRAAIENPPAIFLAWSEGARVVSARFEVPNEAGRPDPVASLRLWHRTSRPGWSPN